MSRNRGTDASTRQMAHNESRSHQQSVRFSERPMNDSLSQQSRCPSLCFEQSVKREKSLEDCGWLIQVQPSNGVFTVRKLVTHKSHPKPPNAFSGQLHVCIRPTRQEGS